MPMIRSAGADRDEDGAPCLVVDGYSCREQLRQATGRLYPTVAELLRDGLRTGRNQRQPRVLKQRSEGARRPPARGGRPVLCSAIR